MTETTAEELVYRRIKPLGKIANDMGLLAADDNLWESLSFQQKAGVIGYLMLTTDKLQRVSNELRKKLEWDVKFEELWQLPEKEKAQ